MVSISRESHEQTERRLRQVIATAEFVALSGEWAFHEGPLHAPPTLAESMLAIVRDEESWSWLAHATSRDTERFAVFSFHFPPELDNSGFVGWLAGVLKRELGTGIFVICGQNTTRGGIYDYWGAPAELRDEVTNVIHRLRAPQ